MHVPDDVRSCSCRTYSVSIYRVFVPQSTRLPVQQGLLDPVARDWDPTLIQKLESRPRCLQTS